MARAEKHVLSATTLAGLTAMANLGNQLVNVALFAFLTPLFFYGLGELTFGILQLTQRMAAFGNATNFGATSYLKNRLNSLAEDADSRAKQTAVCVTTRKALSA